MSDTTTTDPPSLPEKLLAVAKAIRNVEKRGRNDHHGYAFVQATDVVATVRKELHKRKVIVLPSTIPGSVQHGPAIGGRGMVTTVDLSYRFICTETQRELTLTWTGAGADVGGDKGLYKAMTGGLKYALIQSFLIPMGEDPEGDRTTTSGKSNDATRDAAPRIPTDRAKYLAQAAVSAGLAEETAEAPGFTMGPLLRAKLEDVGVSKLGALNADQAEAVEAFIRDEYEAKQRGAA